jgi:predicted O-linked N-acetylglucosamine transferase (SPINDLY family)
MIQAGRVAEAKQACRQVLLQVPDQPDVLHLLGVLAQREGDHLQAVGHIRQAIAAGPKVANFRMTLGISSKALGRVDDAIDAYQQAVKLQPSFGEAWTNLCNLLHDAGRLTDAVAAGRKAVQHAPKLAAAHNNLANALLASGLTAEAITSYERALSLRPGDRQTGVNLARAYFNHQQFDRAAACLQAVLAQNSDDPAALLTLADVRRRQGQLDEARALYERTLEANAGNTEAMRGLAAIHRDEGEAAQAVTMLRKATRLAPHDVALGQQLLLATNYLPGLSPIDGYAEHLRWGERFSGIAAMYASTHDRSPDRRLRIGYVSPDFHKHAVAWFILPLLTHHDRDSVEVFAYANVRTPDGMTDILRSKVEHWIDTTVMDDDTLAARMADDGIDILIDLAGHMPGNRLAAMARKPAPLQINYLGYPNTTGLSAFDYRLTDVIADPEHASTPHVETLVRLPVGASCWQPFAGAPPVNDLPATRNGWVTFGSLSNPAKINHAVVALWSQILHAVSGSRLRLVRQNLQGSLKAMLMEQFASHGIDASRIDIIAPPADADSYLGAYHDIDISLDTHPYAGHTTTCESLWMGVPVVTLTGGTTASRMSASVLHQVGLPQTIAATEDAYVEAAMMTAGDRQGLAQVRQTLRQHMLGCPLLQHEAFTRQFEQTLRGLWREACISQHASRRSA